MIIIMYNFYAVVYFVSLLQDPSPTVIKKNDKFCHNFDLRTCHTNNHYFNAIINYYYYCYTTIDSSYNNRLRIEQQEYITNTLPRQTNIITRYCIIVFYFHFPNFTISHLLYTTLYIHMLHKPRQKLTFYLSWCTVGRILCFEIITFTIYSCVKSRDTKMKHQPIKVIVIESSK